jgi:hypothetical protein
MRLKESLIVGLMVVLSLSMMQSESGRARATEPTRPASAATMLTEAEIAAVLQLTQGASAQAAPRSTSSAGARPQAARRVVSAEFVDDCMEVAEQINPDWAAKLRSFCEHNPEDFGRYIMENGRSLVALVDLKKRDPKLYQTKLEELRIEAQINDLVHKLRHLHSEGRFDTPEAAALKEELRLLVQNQVAYSLKARGDYILRLQEHIKALEQQIEADALRFFYIVEERYQTLIDMP